MNHVGYSNATDDIPPTNLKFHSALETIRPAYQSYCEVLYRVCNDKPHSQQL